MRGGNLLTRSAGGAIAGGAGAALVEGDPSAAGPGAVIGAAMPGAVKLAGAAGAKIGGALRGPAQSADAAAAIQAARANGYVIPPTQANPTLVNRLAEGFGGKLTTAQNASARNAGVTERLAADAIGLPSGTKITPDVLASVRQAAGQQYEAVAQSGVITPGKAYDAALDAIAAPFVTAQRGFPKAKPSPVLDLVDSLRSPQFDASAAVAKLRQLRTAADDAFRTGSTDTGRASKAAANALEDAMEAHLATVGNPADLAAFREARKTIAKTYSIEKALNRETGGVDANKLAGQLAQGKPLSGGLEDAARFAARFPKANQTVERMGSLPQTSPLDWLGGTSLARLTGNPLALAGVMARPAARGYALSDLAQNRLIQRPPSLTPLSDLLQPAAYRAAPLLTAGGQ
jgi:histone H3/H4